MIITTEQLRQKARELALTHVPITRKRPVNRFWREFRADVEKLRTLVHSLQEGLPGCDQPAEEWLLDHAEFIEEQTLAIQHQLSRTFLRRLPFLKKEGHPRMLSICLDYLEHAEGKIDERSFLSYLHSYQEISVLTIAEAWSVPLVLRMALIRKLFEVTEQVRERREICALVSRLLARLEPSGANPETLKEALENAGQDIPLSAPVIVHLVKHLREWADDSATVRDWLLCKLENGPESLDRIVSHEHQLQASYHMKTGNLITSLRMVERWNWRDPFEKICLAEQTLRQEKAGDYPRLDFTSRNSLRKRVEELARRWNVPENLVAKQAVELADEEYDQFARNREPLRHEAGNGTPDRTEGRNGDMGSRGGEIPPRRAYVAYYLLEPDGVRDLRRALKRCSQPRRLPGASPGRRSAGTYLLLGIGFFILALCGFSAWIGGKAGFSPSGWVFALLVLFIPASEWAVAATHWLIERTTRTIPLLRYDFSRGIPEEASTMVVIPVIWSTVEEVEEMAERLELHYLANRDPNLHFALLGDFADAPAPSLPEDEKLLAAARERIEALNRAYSTPGGTTFHLFQRRRLWNPSEGVWMGWERKRGKLVEFVELLKGSTETSYEYIYGDRSVLPRIRYVITLDADTRLPLGSAQRMIGTLHLPYNRPRMNGTGTRVVNGYGILQPRIGISHEAALKSRLASLWGGNPGIDPYAFAVSDPYQDGFGQGIFTGKGIFDVDAFHAILCERIPENRVLSHDLLEGGFLRAGLLSDIELIDDHPATFRSHQKRLHRWVRGDWQLICWLFPRVPDRRGKPDRVDLPVLTRWQIVDNLRRSLLPPALFTLSLLGLSVLPGLPGRWLAVFLATLFLPVIRQLASLGRTGFCPRSLLAAAGQGAVALITLPFQAVLMLDAVARSLYRSFVSKRRLLEWVSSAEIERLSRRRRNPAMLGMGGGYALILLFAVTTFLFGAPESQWAGLFLTLLWASAPLFIRWLDQPLKHPTETLEAEEEKELRKLAKEIWSYFEELVNGQENWLPPDNIQIEPPKGIAHRTSPTNIGLYLACIVAARDLGFLDTPRMVERLEKTVDTVERLKKWNGHLYNWYDTRTLEPLPPHYVSTVDSGNFVCCLIAVKEGVAEWLNAEPDLSGQGKGIRSANKKEESADVAFAEEIAPFPENPAETQPVSVDWRTRGRKLIARLEKLIQETDFRPLYDQKANLFSLGYHVPNNKRDKILYDLLASEARQASFVAIALGQVSASHWNVLGRTMTKIGNKTALLSWAGTMFEYLMPRLLMRTYRGTVWESTYHAAVRRQMEYARQRGVPFGISESGYYAFDFKMNYQYRAFGVPGLGFKRGLEEDLVVSPYATILALPLAGRQGLEALRRMEELGARGKYGFYEAIDFTAGRMPKGKTHMVIKSFMAHHQGMSLLSLANLLLSEKMVDRFHRDKRVRAAELLLQERLPARPKMIRHPALNRVLPHYTRQSQPNLVREYLTAFTPAPEVCLLSNGKFTCLVTNSGSGYLLCDGVAVSRWREDPVLDDWGSYVYIRDVSRDAVWSPTFQPCRVPADEERVEFCLDRATFRRTVGDLESTLEICVSPEANGEIRRLTIANKGNEQRIVEVTTFLEIALAPPDEDRGHPAFSKLFVETEYDADGEILLARRRPRNEQEKPLWAAHTLSAAGETLGPAEYETDRASFIGRGHPLSRPKGIRSRLGGKTGAVADPAFVMRRRLAIEPGQQAQLFAVTATADTREEAVAVVRSLAGKESVERAFQLSWNYAQIELKDLHLPASEAMAYQAFAGRVIFNPPLKPERKEAILANEKGQSGLWAYGISGDRPIVLVRIDHQANLPFIAKLLVGHEYLRRKGLLFDLVILEESTGGYRQDLQEALRRAAERLTGHLGSGRGVTILDAGQLPDADKTLLFAASRLILRADGPSLRAQARLPGKKAPLPEPLVPTKPANRFASPQPPAADQRDLLFFNGWGGFASDGREYRIVLDGENTLPAPWINVIANPQFGFLLSELGTGYTWWRNSREHKLTPWSNDPVLDKAGEICFLRDEESGETWTATPLTGGGEQKSYAVAHGRGYTRFRHERNGIAEEMTLFVPLDDPVKVIQLRLKNNTPEERRLSVTYYAEWVLGVRREPNAPCIVTEWHEPAKILLAHNAYQEAFRGAAAFLGVFPQPADTGVEWSWTADRQEFLGRNGTLEHPEALKRRSLSGAAGCIHDPCGAVQARFSLEPGGERTVLILLGCEHSREAAIRLAHKYRQSLTCEEALRQVQDFWDGVTGQIAVSTPSREMDLLLNGWLVYQALSCRMWARTAFYQAGGAYGFRDQLQDSLALLHARSDLTRAQILLHAAHQYEEGDVQHWWHEETKRGIRTRFSDDLLWLPYAVARYVEHTGDKAILDENVPFLSSEPLREGEQERYEPTQVSPRKATVYEHCLRAIDRALSFGEHGLPLMGSGDWNDGMNRVGANGRGESVWLGWFLCDILKRFAELCRERGDRERSAHYREMRQKLSSSLNQHAWDGQWYRRAFTDAGQWLGSILSSECRIDAIAQSWSVISGEAPENRAAQAMQSFHLELVDQSLSVVRLLTPPFDRTEPNPGYIQGYPPGIRENGGQYTHGAIWSILAWCLLGDGRKAFELFHLLNPINHTRTPQEVRRYAGEPYAMAADVYTAEPHQGRAGWTWYTGAAGWMYQAGIEWILGLRRRGERLYIKPCIPAEWREYSIRYRYGKALYCITVKNPSGKHCGAASLSVDGKEVDLKKQAEEGGPWVELRDDGREHIAILTL